MTDLNSLEINENEGVARIQLGNKDRGATILLLKQYEKYIIDDIMVNSNDVASNYVSMKKELRLAMAVTPGTLKQNAVPVAYTITNMKDKEPSVPVIEPAAFEEPQQEP